MKKVLLHICCGICASSVIDTLAGEGFQVTGFFYNPNIAPEEEYQKRFQVAKEVALLKNITLFAGVYEPRLFNARVVGRETDAEGGERCAICFRMRLEKTLEKSKELNLEYFATTLSISPHKDTAKINAIGKSLGLERFLAYDFKLRDGYRKTSEFAQKHFWYRQNYCGCIFSRRNK